MAAIGLLSAATGCTGPEVVAASGPARSSPPATSAAASAPGGLPVTDGAGNRFTVTATPVRPLPVVTVHGALWSAAPGRAFLEGQIQVANPTSGPEPLGAFDDPSSGLAPAVDLTTDPADATRVGDGADCGADPAYPAALCPVSFPERLTVDDDSADTGGASVVLAPGATARLTYSYGPVPAGVAGAPFAVWFAGSPAVDVTP
ncbi:MAG: hypothetical protein KGJ77_10355 [Acidobacteriota bacterium]|nr:hypothetical protein [Acidobacteriota bacterium]